MMAMTVSSSMSVKPERRRGVTRGGFMRANVPHLISRLNCLGSQVVAACVVEERLRKHTLRQAGMGHEKPAVPEERRVEMRSRRGASVEADEGGVHERQIEPLGGTEAALKLHLIDAAGTIGGQGDEL